MPRTRRMHRWILVLHVAALAGVLWPAAAMAQDPPDLTDEERREKRLILDMPAQPGLAASTSRERAGRTYALMSDERRRKAFKTFAATTERRRVDHQMGAIGGAAGLAARTGLGDLIDFAVESGTITRTFEQNLMTFRAHAVGLARFLTNQPMKPALPAGPWNGVELAASFSTGDGTTKNVQGIPQNASQPVSFSPTVNGGRFTSAFVRWSSEPRTARTSDAIARWARLVVRSDEAVAARRNPGSTPDAEYVRDAEETLLRMAANPTRAESETPGWAFAVEGVLATPALQPKTFSERIIVSWAPASCSDCGTGAFTFNAAATQYADAQITGDGADTGWFRDVTVALQFDRKLGLADSPAVFSASGYAQWQKHKGIIQIRDQTTLPGTTIPIPAGGLDILTEKGWLAVFQASVVFTLPGGVKAPLSFAYANRTEFQKKPDARAFIGLMLSSSAFQ